MCEFIEDEPDFAMRVLKKDIVNAVEVAKCISAETLSWAETTYASVLLPI